MRGCLRESYFRIVRPHTVWTSLANNERWYSDVRLGFLDTVSSLLLLFNHSCEPNVECKRDEGSTTTRLFAKRRIEKEEELFYSYRDIESMELDEN